MNKLDNSKTFTKKDCDQIIKAFEEMSGATKSAITSLQDLSARIDEVKDIAVDMKKSCLVSAEKRCAFMEYINSYLKLHDRTCKVTYPNRPDINVCEIRYYLSNGEQVMVHTPSGYHEALTIIEWSEISDIHDTAECVIDYINRCIV